MDEATERLAAKIVNEMKDLGETVVAVTPADVGDLACGLIAWKTEAKEAWAEVARLEKENVGLKAWLVLYQRKAGHITITTEEREGLPCPYPPEEE